jgi:hypothetical protein
MTGRVSSAICACLISLAFFISAALPGRADALQLFSQDGGKVGVATSDQVLLSLAPMLANASWEFAGAKPVPLPAGAAPDERSAFEINSGSSWVHGDLHLVARDTSVDALWEFQAESNVEFETLVVASDFNLPDLVGGQWVADNANGTFPANFTKPDIFIGKVTSLELTFPSKREVKFTFPAPTMVVLQDNRQWGSATYTLRIGLAHGSLTAGQRYGLAMNVASSDGLTYSREQPDFLKPVTLHADDQWVPLQEDSLDIEPGSALDLSTQGFEYGPCGAKGRIIATPAGHFACADEPDKPRRFYGVNLCFDASYLPKDKADELLDRLVRLGYNAVRIHHYEAQLTSPTWKPGFDWDPAKVDMLDYLMAGCTKRGIWITTDLFVSRPVSGEQLGLPQYNEGKEHRVPMDEYKALIPVSDAAYQDWCTFARKFLDRVNPYTGKRVADDPTVAWISLVNEGPVDGLWGIARKLPEWKTAWNKWLLARYATRDQLAAAIGDLAASEDPQQGTVGVPMYIDANSARDRLGEVFVAETEKATYARMRDFLRNDLKCQALLTNMNDSGPQTVPLEGVRTAFDYVDEHFYVEHPRFLLKAWQLPSYCASANTLAAGAPGASTVATIRLWGKPFILTEYDYPGPSRYRAVGAPLTGAIAALQDWDALWHFDYGADSNYLFTPGKMSYFDLVSDPLNQAADRIAVLLFLRGDITPAPNRLAMLIPPSALKSPAQIPGLALLQTAAWRTRIGGFVDDGTKLDPHTFAVPIDANRDGGSIASVLTQLNVAPGDAGAPIVSETHEISIAPSERMLTIDTPRSAGGYADPGKTVNASNAGVQIDGVTTGATVFVNSLDGAPIKSSKRLLVSHLTDLQNSGAKFGEGALQTLQEWGGLPHLVRDGSATFHIALAEPSAYTVWALSTSGKRLEKMDAKVDATGLVFTASVRGSNGARMLYEVAQ